MATLPLGFFMMCLIIFFSVEKGSWGLYLNVHAILLVVGGTASLLIFTTPFNGLKSLIGSLKELFKKEHALFEYTADFKALSQSRRLPQPSSNQLINDAVELWSQGLSHELFIVLISQKRVELEEKAVDAIAILKNLSKYPPALGMTGTVVGMVALFANLGSGDTGGLGPALALAMTATFFGLLMANVVVQPICDRLNVRFVQQKRLLRNIYQILLLINDGEPQTIVDDEVSYRAAA